MKQLVHLEGLRVKDCEIMEKMSILNKKWRRKDSI